MRLEEGSGLEIKTITLWMIIKALKLDGTTQENGYKDKERSGACALSYFNIQRSGREETRKRSWEEKAREKWKNQVFKKKTEESVLWKSSYQMGQMLIKGQKRLKLRCDS